MQLACRMRCFVLVAKHLVAWMAHVRCCNNCRQNRCSTMQHDSPTGQNENARFFTASKKGIGMNRCIRYAVLCMTAFCFQDAHDVNAAEQELKGTITEVTVYRDLARVVRELRVPATQEIQHLRVTGLPAQIVPRSAFTEADANTSVRSMRVVAKRAAADPTYLDRLKQLRQKKEELLKKLRVAENVAKAVEQDLLTVDKLVDFSADKVKQNLDRATLDVQSVTALADFTMQRRRELASEFLETQVEIEQLEKELEENEQQQNKTVSENVKATYEAVLSAVAPQGGTIRLVYEVTGVNWLPRYSIRSQQDEAGIRVFSIQLDAILVQDSGEPWDDVALTLSTSTPESQAARPLLTPLRVHAVAPGQEPTSQQSSDVSLAAQPEWLDQELMQHNIHLNLLASQLQVMELTTAAEVQREVARDAGDDVAEENYVIDKKVKIVNHPRVQTISILQEKLTGRMHHVATPLLSSFAFREAELTNTSGQNLIAGGADVYLDGEFVGRTTLSPTTAGQRMTIGFGTDRRIRTRRELLDKEEAVQGGNRRSTLKHRLVISSYHETPVPIRLIDRIPIVAKDGAISVSLDPSSEDALSKDALYVRMQRPTGVLRWDLEIPAGSFGSKAYDHEYSYSIELDRQHTIVSNDIQQTLGDLRFQKTNMGGGMGGGAPF